LHLPIAAGARSYSFVHRPPSKLVLFSLSLLILGLGGCDTFSHRSKEKSATFDKLPSEAQEKLRKGVIEIGNTPDMVYIALGQPDVKREIVKAGSRETIWVYNTYYTEYEGNLHVGYQRVLIFDPVRQRYNVFYEPVYADAYSDHVEEYIRVVLRDDKVAFIEQPKH